MSDYKIPFIVTPVPSLEQLALFTGVQVVKILNAKHGKPSPNPYTGAPALEDKTIFSRLKPVAYSIMGTPIYTDLIIKGVTWTDNDGNVQTLANDNFGNGATGRVTEGYGGASGYYQRFDTVLITFTQPIKVIRTEIQGSDGTVKEYIGKDDVSVTINVNITGKNGQYPHREVLRFKKWLDAPVSKPIVAWWLNDLGVKNVVITDYSMPQVEGGLSYQLVQINAISDAPRALQISAPV